MRLIIWTTLLSLSRGWVLNSGWIETSLTPRSLQSDRQLLRLSATVPRPDDEQLPITTTEQGRQKAVTFQSLVEQFAWYIPPALAVMAFTFYGETSRAFHEFIDTASGHQWQMADGGAFVSEMVKSALGGPVTFSVSILFGTMVGLTVSSLWSRQMNIHRSLVGIFEELRELELFVDDFPQPYKQRCKQFLKRYFMKLSTSVQNAELTAQTLRKERELSRKPWAIPCPSLPSCQR